MQDICGLTQRLEADERLDREQDTRLGGLLCQAIEAVDLAWNLLATEIQRFGYSEERPIPENGTLYSYFYAMKWDILEMSDSVYSSLSSEERTKDDRDLEDFEVSYMFREDYSPRLKALALLTAARILISDE
ncbi:hypothetical protein [Ensifer sp. ENS12]|uniref:hypothetical protein n=1 Tax=Ensifer sp. ENS12 TaxID=2854774 RepID=UPI001C451B8D|nr:hypothetical protein [Ensifer sp. ENS12]MBV7521146.1 hypothetical protein [Ensifer sp. ENS12]